MPAPDGGPTALFTDLYELTMSASYHARGLDQPATFDLFVRSLPAERRFLVACGLEQALDYLESLRFVEEDIDYLESLQFFPPAFLERLSALRFTGDVWAMPEGEAVFAGEPLLQVTAPMIEAQLVETFMLNCLAHQTMVASKAARVALACGRCAFVDFSARRVHGVDAGLLGSRASYIAGAAATSLTEAGRRWRIPVRGTMAHSYVMRFDREADAFKSFARDMPEGAVLLIDTYDTVEGARQVVRIADELASEGVTIGAVRLDSGDLGELAKQVRAVLDEGGLHDVSILVSGDLDEHRVAALVSSGAPIDSFGVGTKMGTSEDAPNLNAVYKLVEDADGPKLKLSTGKVTLPGRKQVWRELRHGRMELDVIGLQDEVLDGVPLLEQVMAGGSRISPSPSLDSARRRCEATLGALPERLRGLEGEEVEPYPVELSAGLGSLVERFAPGHFRPD